jgi:peptidoglycan/xylan/chitin deacetylase (PgdA/CDA1 family)
MYLKNIEIEVYNLISKSLIGKKAREFNQNTPNMILVYHGVETHQPTCVDPDLFRDHLTYLKHNCEIVQIEDLIKGQTKSNKPLVSITFDDAYVNLIENALPALSSFNFPATIYAPSGCLGKKNEWDSGSSMPLLPIMTGAQLRMVSEFGFEIGSHTQNHPRLKYLDSLRLHKEITDSKQILEDIVGKPVRSFAYPHGGRNDIDSRSVDVVRSAGYLSGATTFFGRYNSIENRYMLRRVTIWPSDTYDTFKMKMTGYYDWLVPKEILINQVKKIIWK